MNINIKKLGEFCEFKAGGTPSRSKSEYWENGSIPWVKIGDLKNKYITNTSEYITKEGLDNSSAKLLKKGTLVYSIFATLGEVSILDIDATTNQAIVGIINDNSEVDTNYLYYFLKSKREYVNNIGRGVAQNNINISILKDIDVYVPNISFQKRIVEILDKAQELIDKRKEQIEALDELVKSKFIDMFGDPGSNPMKWPEGTIRDIVTEVKYGTSKPAVEGGKYKYLRMNNITYNGELDITNLKYIDIPDNEVEKYIVRKGDVLFNRTNSKELVGKTCVFDLDEPMIIAGYIIRIRMNDKALPEYLSAVLNSKYGKDVLYGMCKAIVGQANINAQELQDIKIFIPPIKLQKQYVEFIQKVNKLKLEMEKSLKELEDNFNSLMQKAFKGELFN